MPCPKVGLKLATASPNGQDARRGSGPACGIGAIGWSGTCGTPRRRSARPCGSRRRGGGNDFVGQRAHSGEVVRRFDLGHAERGQAPGAVLVTQHAEPERLLPGRARDDDLLRDQPVGDAQLVGGVADADVDAVLAGVGQIPTAPTRPAAGYRGQRCRRRGRPAPASPVSSRTPVTCCRGGVEVRLRDAGAHDVDVGDRRRAPRICHSRCGRLGTYAVNSSRSCRVVPRTWPAAPKWMQSGRFSRIGTPAATMSSSRPGKSALEFLGAARHQQMDVPALGHRRPVGRLRRAARRARTP